MIASNCLQQLYIFTLFVSQSITLIFAHKMKSDINYIEFKAHIMRFASDSMDKDFFCKLHGISLSQLNRILSGKCQCKDELFFYILQNIDVEVEFRIKT